MTSTGLLQLSTSSVTLIDVNKVITAGHCHTPSEALNSSVTFDYFTNRDGSRPAGYNPKFIKVKAVLAHHYDSVGDLSLLQPAEAPVRIPVLQMRPIRRVSASRCLASIIRTAWFTVTPRDNSVLRKNGFLQTLALCRKAGFAGKSRVIQRPTLWDAAICLRDDRWTALFAKCGLRDTNYPASAVGCPHFASR